MTFWQENYGFVKEVYDFRCSKYAEWMDNIEAIIGKVMANTQYTAKEFKIIKDTFTSLCRDLDKEGTKQWLDMMLDKLSSHNTEGDVNLSLRDKNLKAQEKKKLETMIERHNSLLEPTMNAQSKVEHYSECYAFGDDIHPIIKVLDEQQHLSTKEIHPHNMDMTEEQIDKQEKVLRTLENQGPIYQELMKRGEKLRANPNAPEFLEKEIARLDGRWKESNEKAKIRLDLLHNAFKDWDVYEQKRVQILAPLDALDEQFKGYKKIYDPKKGADWLERKKKKAEDLKKQIIELYNIIKTSFAVILNLAGEEKKEFMEKEILEIDERRQIVEKVDKELADLTTFNERLTKATDLMAEIHTWMVPACDKLKVITSSVDLSPEDRVKEIFDLQAQLKERLPKVEPLGIEIHELLDIPVTPEEEGGQTSETALKHIEEFDNIKATLDELHEKIEIEAGSITQDQKHFADYLYGLKNFKPWMEEAEAVVKKPLDKPQTIDEVKKLLETNQTFAKDCGENKGKLDSAAESKSKMEKVTKEDNEVPSLNNRWGEVKKVADERVNKIQQLCDTWSELENVTQELTKSITEIPGTQTPDVASLEKIFNRFREVNTKKMKLYEAL